MNPERNNRTNLTPRLMTELEKMLTGELYNANDPVLLTMRANGRECFIAYNQTINSEQGRRTQLLRELLGSLGEQIDSQPPFYCDYGRHIHLGTNVFINYNCTLLDCGWIHIGNNVFIRPNVSFYAAYHPIIASERIKRLELASPITVGNNV